VAELSEEGKYRRGEESTGEQRVERTGEKRGGKEGQ